MRRFFQEVLPSQQQPLCFLGEQESHHIFRVIKLAKGEELILFNGKGESCLATLEHTQNHRVCVRWKEDLVTEEQGAALWLCLSLLKQQAWSTALRMATELGVHHIVPVCAQRSIVRQEKRERWNKILLAASKQCGRTQIPMLHSMCRMQDLKEVIPCSSRYVLLPKKETLVQRIQEESALLIGPEGGFTPKEEEALQNQGWLQRSLSAPVLRADTAVCAAVSLCLLS